MIVGLAWFFFGAACSFFASAALGYRMARRSPRLVFCHAWQLGLEQVAPGRYVLGIWSPRGNCALYPYRKDSEGEQQGKAAMEVLSKATGMRGYDMRLCRCEVCLERRRVAQG